MKSWLQALLLCSLVIGLAYLMTEVMFNYSAYNTESSQIDKYQQAMLDDKSCFVEKSDPIQDVAAGLVDRSGVLFMRGKDGQPYRIENGRAVASTGMDSAFNTALTDIFGENKAGVTLQMVTATPDAVCYITHLYDNGFVGFLYEKELGNTTGYETIEIVENWKLFAPVK